MDRSYAPATSSAGGATGGELLAERAPALHGVTTGKEHTNGHLNACHEAVCGMAKTAISARAGFEKS